MKVFVYQFDHDGELKLFGKEINISQYGKMSAVGTIDLPIELFAKELATAVIDSARESLIKAGIPTDAYDIKITYKQKEISEDKVIATPEVIEKVIK
jgi:hypothetical protein